MAVTVSNIVVGEGTIKAGPSASATSHAAMDAFTDIGATQNGVEISWEPDMVDIEIDQFGDAAKVIQSKVKVMVKTTMAESGLKNLALAWNFDQTDSANTGTHIKNNTDGANTKTFLFAAQTVFPYELGLVVQGYAPGTVAGGVKTRKFYTKRAISMDSSSISFKRSEASTFAVGFRILPNVEDTGYEYGKIVDQV